MQIAHCRVSLPAEGDRRRDRCFFFRHWKSSSRLFCFGGGQRGKAPPSAQPAKRKKAVLCTLNLTSFKLGLPVFLKTRISAFDGDYQQPAAGKEQRPPRIAVDPRVVKSNSMAWPSASNPHPSFALQAWPTQTGLATPTIQNIGQYKYFLFSFNSMKGGRVKKDVFFPPLESQQDQSTSR